MSPQRKAALQLLTAYPKAATQTLARIAVKEWPELWHSLDAARAMFRSIRGALGDKKPVAEHVRPKGKSGDPFGKLPRPRETLSKWSVLEINGPARVLCLADVHIPYHDPAALKAAIHYGKDRKANVVLLNGDIADFFSVSRWENDPRERNFAGELADVKAFLGCIRDTFPAARIVYKLGNHEERYVRYMRLKAPEFLGVDQFELANVLDLAKLKIELVGDNRPIRIGRLNFLHGHEYRFAISNPVNPARGLFLRGKVHAVCGHFHQTSQHSEKDLEQHVVSTWSTGCLCDLHPEYRPLNNWGHGFLFADIDASGAFQVSNERVIDGKVWH